MNWVKSFYHHLIEITLITAFNALILLEAVSEEEVENLIRDTAKKSIFQPILVLSDVMELASRQEGFYQSDKSERNRILALSKDYTALLMTEFCYKTIWNKSLSEKIRDKILQDLFRKLSWQFRSIGLDFSSEVPSSKR